MWEVFRPWTRASNYIGPDYRGSVVLATRTRDTSDPLEVSNYDSIVRQVERLPGVEVVHFSHWAHGWGEQVLLLPSAPVDVVEEARALDHRLAAYPVVDEDNWIAVEFAYVCDRWGRMGLADRARVLRELGYSLFSARARDPYDADDRNGGSGALPDRLRS